MYTLHSNMSANRVQYFIRSILQNSKLNRENFVNNKKKYNMMFVKNRNHNMVIKRNFSLSPDNKSSQKVYEKEVTDLEKPKKKFKEYYIELAVVYLTANLVLDLFRILKDTSKLVINLLN